MEERFCHSSVFVCYFVIPNRRLKQESPGDKTNWEGNKVTHCLLPQVGDELLEINGNNTEGMLHSDAITIIKHGGNVVKLIVRRGEPFIGSGNFQEHKSPPLPSPPAGSYAPADLVSPTAAATKDRYAQDYMNSLNKRRSPGDRRFHSSVSPPPNQ